MSNEESIYQKYFLVAKKFNSVNSVNLEFTRSVFIFKGTKDNIRNKQILLLANPLVFVSILLKIIRVPY